MGQVNSHIHQLITSHRSHDPDVEHTSFSAITTHFLRDLHWTVHSWNMRFDAASKALLAMQHRLFYIAMALAHFNLYAVSYHYLSRPTDDLGPLESLPHRQLRSTIDIRCPSRTTSSRATAA